MVDIAAMFDPTQVTKNVDLLASGAVMTIALSATAIVLAAAIGMILAVLRASPWQPLSWGSRLYIELIRGTPLLVQMYILYYGLPSFGITLSAFLAAAIALALNSSAYVGEILRTAVQSIDRSQRESARAAGMTVWTTQIRIVLPQALPIALPALMGEVIDIIKWSSLGAIVVVPEATQVVYQIVGQSYRGFGILFLTLAIFYLVITATLSWLSRELERRLTQHRIKLAHA